MALVTRATSTTAPPPPPGARCPGQRRRWFAGATLGVCGAAALGALYMWPPSRRDVAALMADAIKFIDNDPANGVAKRIFASIHSPDAPFIAVYELLRVLRRVHVVKWNLGVHMAVGTVRWYVERLTDASIAWWEHPTSWLRAARFAVSIGVGVGGACCVVALVRAIPARLMLADVEECARTDKNTGLATTIALNAEMWQQGKASTGTLLFSCAFALPAVIRQLPEVSVAVVLHFYDAIEISANSAYRLLWRQMPAGVHDRGSTQ